MCSPQRLLCNDVKIEQEAVNNNKLFAVNKEKTTFGSKIRRICMGMFFLHNSAKINSNVLGLGDRHNAIVGNMMKARLRMSDAI